MDDLPMPIVAVSEAHAVGLVIVGRATVPENSRVKLNGFVEKCER
jgi:hypothetical protein